MSANGMGEGDVDLDLTDPVLASEAELAFEGALRPKSLAEFVGQTR